MDMPFFKSFRQEKRPRDASASGCLEMYGRRRDAVRENPFAQRRAEGEGISKPAKKQVVLNPGSPDEESR